MLINKIYNKVWQEYNRIAAAVKYCKSRKVFCIGRNKTGTTSLTALLMKLGVDVAPQHLGEQLITDYLQGNFDPIIKFSKYSGEAFQDIPYSLPETYIHLSRAFPQAKFILTIRDSADEWYSSLVTFHGKLFAGGRVPTREDLQAAKYIYPGALYDINRVLYQSPEDDIYNEEILKKSYDDYNAGVLLFFKDMTERLLVINLRDAEAVQKIKNFLQIESDITQMPWENKTSDKNTRS